MGTGRLLPAVAAFLVGACGGAESPGGVMTGSAVVQMLDREWRITGTCESAGNDLTFIGPGDPMLSIGISTADDSNPVGNFSSAREGFGIVIGSREAPAPAVQRINDSFTVSGTFTVFDEDRVEGTVMVNCNG